MRALSFRDKAFRVFVIVMSILVIFITAYPMYFVLIASFSNAADVANGKVWLFPNGIYLDGYKKMIGEVVKAYPNFKAVATTLRTVKSASVNDWSAICYADGQVYKAADYKGLEIFDRVGGGDSFASGLVYGLMTFQDAQKAVEYGAAHGALAMTTPGDTSMANLKEVEGLVKGAGARVQR
jgi:ABC-type sugar transport system permease subunit